MKPTLIEFIRQAWCEITAAPFSRENVVKSMIHDGGYDFVGTKLTFDDLQHLWSGIDKNCTGDMLFFLSELLGVYRGCAARTGLSPEQVAGWCLASISMAEIIWTGDYDWDLVFDKVISTFCTVRKHMTTDSQMLLFEHLFRIELD